MLMIRIRRTSIAKYMNTIEKNTNSLVLNTNLYVLFICKVRTDRPDRYFTRRRHEPLRNRNDNSVTIRHQYFFVNSLRIYIAWLLLQWPQLFAS